MKRHIKKIGIFLVLLLALGLAGCNKKEVEDKNQPIENLDSPMEDVVETEENRDKLMEEFQQALDSESAEDVVDFINKNIGKVTTIEGDRMVSNLENLLEDNKDSLTTKLIALDPKGELMEIGNTELFFPKESIKDIRNKDLKEEVEKLYNNRFKLINLEGQYYPIVDYDSFKDYYKGLSEELKDYYNIKAKESDQPTAIDGGLYISFDELADRIIQAEKYIQRYGGGIRYGEIHNTYGNLLDIYLSGLPNTPINDPNTKEINKAVMKSYMETAKVEGSITAHVVNKYISLISENKGIINQNILDKAKDLVKEGKSLLESSK